jgi:hypothetical protein
MAKNIEKQGTADFDWEALQLDGYNQVERSELGRKNPYFYQRKRSDPRDRCNAQQKRSNH